jgi:hypothetical protein
MKTILERSEAIMIFRRLHLSMSAPETGAAIAPGSISKASRVARAFVLFALWKRYSRSPTRLMCDPIPDKRSASQILRKDAIWRTDSVAQR